MQNALDEAESYRWGYDDQGLWISDRGRGIAVVKLSVWDPAETETGLCPGKFGEGMKVASLVFLRQGYSVLI